MFKLFSKSSHTSVESASPTVFSVQPLCCPCINFEQFTKGIDNVHIDVQLSPNFTRLTQDLIEDLLNERSSTKRRFTDKPSKKVLEQLDAFNASYANMLTEAIHNAKEEKRVDQIQLFQIAVIKLVLNTVWTKADHLIEKLRKTTLKGSQKNLQISERIAWINRNQNNLLFQVTHELFDQILWVEMSKVGKLRESLLGAAWTIPKDVLSNPLLQSQDTQHHNVLMKHYVLMSQDPDDCYGFERLSALIDKVLNEVSQVLNVQIKPPEEECAENEFMDELDLTPIRFSWKDVPANMDILFDIQATQQALQDAESPEQKANLKAQLLLQQKANKILESKLRQENVIIHLLAAYETPRLYKQYLTLIKPYLFYQALCDEVTIQEVALKLQNQLKVRTLRNYDPKDLSINELKKTKARLAKLARKPDKKILKQFVSDFIAYRRDLKYHRLMQGAMEKIHLLTDEADIQLSKSNDMLYEFYEPGEQTQTKESIRCHAIVKADLRGSTTMTDELFRRGLNPATHFSRNFFNPIRQLIKTFGAEKVFIEGDAVILSLFEYPASPDQWLATARACGLAKNMLEVVDKQNEVSRLYDLPELELGIGICYSPEAPKFLYDGEQRIMISPAIGAADRLSSCSWKLRRKYAKQPDLLTHVMVFQQPPDDAFKGEKGMTTFRYNLNGIELDPGAFKKLQSEMALRQIKLRLPNEKEASRFYIGYYPDVTEETHQVVIREGKVKIWQEDSEDYPLTDTLYYEVVTNKKILNLLRKKGL
jgi:hypothetical protein